MLILALLFIWTPGVYPAENVRHFESINELRNEVLHFIGNAERRIWLTTDYLTDGEIVTALTIARYRKIDVQVLLGRTKASQPMSRLGYLKAQNIPVFIKSGKFTPDQTTMLLVDDFVYLIDGELDSLAKYKNFNFILGTNSQRLSYEGSFAAAAHLAIPANPKPLPLVGRPQWSKPMNSKPSKSALGKGNADPVDVGTVDDEGIFHHSNQRTERPENVAPTLPKVPVWLERARKKQPPHEVTLDSEGQMDESRPKKK